MIRPLALLLACAAVGGLRGQGLVLKGSASVEDVIVEAFAEGGGDQAPLLRAIWRHVPEGRAECALQRLSGGHERLLLDRLAEAAIGAYLDARVSFAKTGVRAALPAADMARDINGMLAALVEAAGADVAFEGLSGATVQQLDRLLRIDWSKAASGIDGGAVEDKYLAIYFYVRAQRQELERQVRADLLPLAEAAALGPQRPAPGHTVRVNSTCGTVFDEENFLCALDLRLADTSGGIGLEPSLPGDALAAMARHTDAPSAPAPGAAVKVRKRDRWLKQELDAINQRIDRMDLRKELWELRDRMDDIDDRLTGLELEVRETGGRGEDDNPSANLSALAGRNIIVRFDRGSIGLEPDQRVLLNEVFEQLARNPAHRLLITGYADRSGDPERNLRLSEQRAHAVRGYLLARGIGPERLLVNYYGDSRSLGPDPAERRVELEWLR
ncbi:MAG: OmpA family protein [Flavobacteriales bacterium]